MPRNVFSASSMIPSIGVFSMCFLRRSFSILKSRAVIAVLIALMSSALSLSVLSIFSIMNSAMAKRELPSCVNASLLFICKRWGNSSNKAVVASSLFASVAPLSAAITFMVGASSSIRRVGVMLVYEHIELLYTQLAQSFSTVVGSNGLFERVPLVFEK